jgi:translation initiation factor IF-3
VSKKFAHQVEANKNRVDYQIRISPILLIDENGQKVGVVPLSEGLKRAQAAELNLVEISATSRPPVCKIINYSKFKYEQQIKEKENKANQKQGQLKELQLTPRIEDNDLQVKCRHAKDFIEHGHKVQFKLKYANRELAHKELGFEIMKKICSTLEDCASVSSPAKLEGKNLICILEPKQI